jgi:hypothetical protein
VNSLPRTVKASQARDDEEEPDDRGEREQRAASGCATPAVGAATPFVPNVVRLPFRGLRARLEDVDLVVLGPSGCLAATEGEAAGEWHAREATT